MARPKTVFMAMVAFAAAALPVATLAQTSAAPSYAQPAPRSGEETIRGSIVSLDGAGNLQLHDDRGFIGSVRLDPNADVTPVGVQLQPGVHVTLAGSNAGSYFAADRVDAVPSAASAASIATAPAPYAAYPYPAYPYGAYPYPYPAYPYPVYAYPYPTFSIGIGFGFHGNGYRGRYRR